MDLQFKDRDWQRTLIDWATCLGAGIIGAFAHAPYFWWPLLVISFGLLVLTIDRTVRSTRGFARGRAVFALGWVWGIGYLCTSLWWIANALMVDADQFAWAKPLAMFGLPSALALFYGVATLLALLFWRPVHDHPTAGQLQPFALTRLVGLAAMISLTEWLRGTMLTGFPWNSIYQSLGGDLPMMQAANVIGPWGLGLLLTLALILPSAVLDRRVRSRATVLALAASFVIGGSLYIYGLWRLDHAKTAQPDPTGVTVQIIQPNIAQKDKWRRELLDQHVQTLLELSGPQPIADPTGTIITIWPEVAVPFQLTRETMLRHQIGKRIGAGNLLLTGAFRPADKTDPNAPQQYHNAIFAIDDTGAIVGHYDKHHLVPFGEYLPLKIILEKVGLRRLTQGIGSLASGTGPQTISLSNAQGDVLPPVGPQVCYEAIFPSEQTNPDGPRPAWLVNVTNDAWYGDTPGPRQHLAQARFRAVEQGLPLARSANTGISALIDPYGRIIDQLPLNTQGTIAAPLPAALAPTLYAKIGDMLFWSVWGLLIIGSFFAAHRGQQP